MVHDNDRNDTGKILKVRKTNTTPYGEEASKRNFKYKFNNLRLIEILASFGKLDWNNRHLRLDHPS